MSNHAQPIMSGSERLKPVEMGTKDLVRTLNPLPDLDSNGATLNTGNSDTIQGLDLRTFLAQGNELGDLPTTNNLSKAADDLSPKNDFKTDERIGEKPWTQPTVVEAPTVLITETVSAITDQQVEKNKETKELELRQLINSLTNKLRVQGESEPSIEIVLIAKVKETLGGRVSDSAVRQMLAEYRTAPTISEEQPPGRLKADNQVQESRSVLYELAHDRLALLSRSLQTIVRPVLAKLYSNTISLEILEEAIQNLRIRRSPKKESDEFYFVEIENKPGALVQVAEVLSYSGIPALFGFEILGKFLNIPGEIAAGLESVVHQVQYKAENRDGLKVYQPKKDKWLNDRFNELAVTYSLLGHIRQQYGYSGYLAAKTAYLFRTTYHARTAWGRVKKALEHNLGTEQALQLVDNALFKEGGLEELEKVFDSFLKPGAFRKLSHHADKYRHLGLF